MPKQTRPQPQPVIIQPYQPPQPTLWQRYRGKVAIAGVVVGLVLVLPHVNDTDTDHAQLVPGSSRSADAHPCTQTP